MKGDIHIESDSWHFMMPTKLSNVTFFLIYFDSDGDNRESLEGYPDIVITGNDVYMIIL